MTLHDIDEQNAGLTDWLLHRAALFGMEWPDGVAADAGVSRELLEAIIVTNDLQHLSRSARA